MDALRFPEDVRRLPANVTVIGQDDIAKSAARTLPELLQEQVGITMKDFFGNNAAVTAIDMRGFGISGAQNTLILVDGRRLTDPDLTSPQWSSIPLAGVERIEIVRGAGSVLYGDGATAGVINIVTRSPLKEGAAVDGYGRIASFHTREGQLYGSTTAGNFGLNASVYGYGSDGYRDNNRNEQKNGTANLRWALGATTLDLRLGADNQNLGLPGARFVQPSIGLNEYKSDPRGAQTPQDKASRDGRRAGVSLAHMLGDTELVLGVDWRKKKEEADYEQRFVTLDTRLSVLSLTPRVRVPFQFGGLDHRLTVGADWNSWDYDSRRDNPAGDLDQPVNRIRATQKNAALYFQDLVELSRATRLSLGWRRERVRYDAKDKLDTTAPGFCPPPFFICQAAAAPASATKHQNAWDLGLRHGLTRELAAYARAGRVLPLRQYRRGLRLRHVLQPAVSDPQAAAFAHLRRRPGMARRRHLPAREPVPHRREGRNPSRPVHHGDRQHQPAAVAPPGRGAERRVAGDILPAPDRGLRLHRRALPEGDVPGRAVRHRDRHRHRRQLRSAGARSTSSTRRSPGTSAAACGSRARSGRPASNTWTTTRPTLSACGFRARWSPT